MAKQLKNKGPGGEKKFAVRPFTAIKGLTVEKGAPPAVPAVTPAPPRKPTDTAEDDLLFLSEMAGVTRIHPRPAPRKGEAREGAPPGKREPVVEPDESHLFLDALNELKLDVRFSEDLPEDDAPAAPRRSSRMRQLRRGTIPMNLEIDLHGLTSDEALDALASFIPAAARRGQQAILVIVGKGNHSEGEPVLQRAVAGWLSGRGQEWVPEFVPAPEGLGGSGAFIVFLRTGQQTR